MSFPCLCTTLFCILYTTLLVSFYKQVAFFILKDKVLFDDGDLHDQTLRGLKALLDTKAQNSMLWARWGSTTFEQGQARAATDNTFNEKLGEEINSGLLKGDMDKVALTKLID